MDTPAKVQNSSEKSAPQMLGESGFDTESAGQLMAAPAFQLMASGEDSGPPIQRKDSSGGMPGDLVGGFAATTGHDLSDVNVHYNSDKPSQVGALAYCQGNDIHLGAGQEQHLAHEAAHVVQQREGRVQATTEVAGMPVNDNKGLESEADNMGAKAMQMKSASAAASSGGGYQSKALQMRSANRAVQMKSNVMQLKVDTKYGEWHDDVYEKLTDGPLAGTQITLRFKPKDGVDAELIGLTQACRIIRESAPSYVNKDNYYKNRAISAADSKATTASERVVPTNAAETDEGHQIDRLKDRNTPIYGSPDLAAGKTLADTPLNNNITADPTFVGPPEDGGNSTYQLGWNYTDASKVRKSQDAILYDRPMLFATPNTGHIFETTALAIKGVQTNMYYGSVRWGWRADAAGAVTLIPFEKVTDGVPSATFMKSAELWNADKSATGADTVDLPTVDVKITTARIVGQYPAGFTGTPLAIPSGTRVQVIRAAAGTANGQIKVVDGALTGNTIEVAPADMANLRDERA